MNEPVVVQDSVQQPNILEAIFDPNNKMAALAASIPEHEVKNIPGLAEYKAKMAAGGGEEGSEEEEVEEGGEENQEKKPAKKAAKKSTSTFFANDDDSEIPDFKEGDDVLAYMKKMGVESPKQFFTEHKNLQAKAAEAEKYQGTTKEFQNWFQTIPQEIFDVLQTYNNNGDWKGMMSQYASQKIDFSKDFSQQNAYDVVSHYFPEITKEEFDAAEENPTVKKAIQLAQSSYRKDQEAMNEQRELSQREIQENSNKVRSSIQSS
jgi:hypothetical protein